MLMVSVVWIFINIVFNVYRNTRLIASFMVGVTDRSSPFYKGL